MSQGLLQIQQDPQPEQSYLFAFFDMLSQAVQIVQECPVNHMGRRLQGEHFRIGFHKVNAFRPCQSCFMEHHQQFIRSQTTHVLGCLRHVGCIQTVCTYGNVDIFRILADYFQGFGNGGLPAVFMDVDGTNDRRTIFHGIVVFFPMVSGPADPDVGNLRGIHIRIVVNSVERRATGQFIIAEMRVIVQVGIKVQDADFLGMAFGDFADDGVGNTVIPADGNGDNLGISQFANPLPDGFEGKVVVAILGGNIAGISHSQVIEAIQVVIRRETGITEE